MTPEERLDVAAREFLNRKHGRSKPEGRWDRKDRWFPAQHEECRCCQQVRRPTGRFPFSLWRHCHTARHIAHLFDVDERELRRAIRQIELMERL